MSNKHQAMVTQQDYEILSAIYVELSKQFKRSVKDIKDIVETQFAFVQNKIRRGDRKTIQLMALGKFIWNSSRNRAVRSMTDARQQGKLIDGKILEAWKAKFDIIFNINKLKIIIGSLYVAS